MAHSPDAAFFKAYGVPDSQGISHPQSFPFYVSDTNPNVHGGCLCERADNQRGPYVVFPGDMYDINNPRPVLCAGCVGDCVALLEGKPIEPPKPAPVIEVAAQNVVEEVEDVKGL